VVGPVAEAHARTLRSTDRDAFAIEDGRRLDDREGAIGDPPGEPPDRVTLQPNLSAVAPGQSATLSVSLRPGSYAMLCFIGDMESGQPHAALVMVTTFTAQ